MLVKRDKILKDKTRRYLLIDDISEWISLTLTMKQRVNGEKLDKISSYNNFRIKLKKSQLHYFNK